MCTATFSKIKIVREPCAVRWPCVVMRTDAYAGLCVRSVAGSMAALCAASTRGVSRIHHGRPARFRVGFQKIKLSNRAGIAAEARWRDLVCPNKTELTLFDAERSEVRNAAIPGVSDQQTRSISKVQNYCS